MGRFFCCLFLLVVTSSCISRLEKHGYMFDLSDHETIQEDITSKERTLKIMGSPTVIAELGRDESWIYYAEDVKHLLFFKPKITSRNILIVRFDNSDTVTELRKIDLANEEKKLTFSSNYTAVDNHKSGFFKSIFSNIGQVKPQ